MGEIIMINILSQLQSDHLSLHNRLILPALAIERADENGYVTQAAIDHYKEKSDGGCFSMIIVEHCFITQQGKASKRQLSIAKNETISGLSKIADVIQTNGSKAILQISHAGGAASRVITGVDTVAPSNIAAKNGEVNGILDKAAIEEVVTLFAKAAKRAKDAGFDGVEIHSAHAYLLNQFYSPITNKRTDEYGGDVVGRTKIHRDIIALVRSYVGEEFPILLRLGACDYMEGGNTITDAIQAVKLLEHTGIDMLDISGGMIGSILKGKEEVQGYFGDATQAIKEVSLLPVILTGGITDIFAADELIKSGKADLVGVGRAMLRDPQWAKRALADL